MNAQIKKAQPADVKDFNFQNAARKLVGLPIIQFKVLKCLSCDTLFESLGNRLCGCLDEEENYYE